MFHLSKKTKTLLTFLFFASFFGLFIRLCVLENYRIKSSSMNPTLHRGDLVFVLKSAFNIRLPFSNYEIVKFRGPNVGEVVAFTLPDQPGETYVKRVAAVGGETLSIREGKLYVDNQLRSLPGDEPFPADYGPVDVPKSYFFALGDNHKDSIDGRSWGPIPDSCLRGTVGLVWLSIAEAGRLGIWVK